MSSPENEAISHDEKSVQTESDAKIVADNDAIAAARGRLGIADYENSFRGARQTSPI